MNKCINPIPLKLDHILSAKFQKTKSVFPQSVHQTEHLAMEFSSHKKHTLWNKQCCTKNNSDTHIFWADFIVVEGGAHPVTLWFLVINLERPKEELTSRNRNAIQILFPSLHIHTHPSRTIHTLMHFSLYRW